MRPPNGIHEGAQPNGEHLLDEMPDWDRTEWVGEGQEPDAETTGSIAPNTSSDEARWSKWQWIGDGQGEPGPNRARPASAMPDGESELSGHNHVPSAEHWAGSGWAESRGRHGRTGADDALEDGHAGSEPRVVAIEVEETIIEDRQ